MENLSSEFFFNFIFNLNQTQMKKEIWKIKKRKKNHYRSKLETKNLFWFRWVKIFMLFFSNFVEEDHEEYLGLP